LKVKQRRWWPRPYPAKRAFGAANPALKETLTGVVNGGGITETYYLAGQHATTAAGKYSTGNSK